MKSDAENIALLRCVPSEAEWVVEVTPNMKEAVNITTLGCKRFGELDAYLVPSKCTVFLNTEALIELFREKIFFMYDSEAEDDYTHFFVISAKNTRLNLVLPLETNL